MSSVCVSVYSYLCGDQNPGMAVLVLASGLQLGYG